MTIGRFLSVSISLLALIACALGAMVAFEKWTAMQAKALASVRLEALQAMADIPATINSERGLFGLQLPVVAPGDSSQHGVIADGVRLTDAAFAKAKAKVAALSGRAPEADDLIAGVDKAIASWIDARKIAEQVLAEKPIDQRADTPQMLVDQNTKTNAAVAVLMRDQLRRLASASGNAYRYADIANSVTELRDVGGRQFGILINATGSKKPASIETRTGITLLEGQIQLIGVHLSALSDIPGLPDGLKVALQNVKTVYFGDIANDKKKVVPALETGAYPFDALELRGKSMVAWKKVIELRDAAYVAAEDQTAAENAEETASFAISVAACLLALVLSIGIGILVRLRVTKPLARMTENMSRIAGGELTLAIAGLDRSDEVGGMAKALQVFKDGLVRNRDLEIEAAHDRDAVEERRKATLSELAATFEASVGAIVGAVATSSREMESAARSMSQMAVETSNRSTAVAAAAEEASTNVSAVASSTEELGSSVQEISRQVQQSSQMSQAAVSEASETAMIVKELSLAASKISDVVSLISSIAGQTNLLALNATIEAARAGEAGRGFAIVASEVKELANQTAKATSEISDQIGAIQNSTGRAVGAIDGIAKTIKSMNDVAEAISESVAQQGAATNEIVRTIEQASIGTGEVTDNISGVAHAAQEAGTVAQQVLSSSGILSKQSADLRFEVEKFLKTVRSA